MSTGLPLRIYQFTQIDKLDGDTTAVVSPGQVIVPIEKKFQLSHVWPWTLGIYDENEPVPLMISDDLTAKYRQVPHYHYYSTDSEVKWDPVIQRAENTPCGDEGWSVETRHGFVVDILNMQNKNWVLLTYPDLGANGHNILLLKNPLGEWGVFVIGTTYPNPSNLHLCDYLKETIDFLLGENSQVELTIVYSDAKDVATGLDGKFFVMDVQWYDEVETDEGVYDEVEVWGWKMHLPSGKVYESAEDETITITTTTDSDLISELDSLGVKYTLTPTL